MQKETKFEELLCAIEQNGVVVEKEIHGLQFVGIDTVAPQVFFLLCLRGSARTMYDMQPEEVVPNSLDIILPGHVLRQIDCSDDFMYARVSISKDIYEELKLHAFSHESEKFNYAPNCRLTDIQAKRVMAIIELLDIVVSHDTQDLQQKRQMILAQMAIGLEFINYYRCEQDKQWKLNSTSTVYAEFCDLVVRHHTENRNVNFYAEKLGYDPRYFSKLFRQLSNGMSPLAWIQQYVATQAKRMMDKNPQAKIKEVAFQLGFPNTADFCRYFKRATGIYPQAYRRS
ncbi:MAG: helix-turn-helix domain-containing protein [Paludibacteraceae bacterium]|nr:helix-turn-helix domain-containing protein [Paludibacteraceae bacterium]